MCKKCDEARATILSLCYGVFSSGKRGCRSDLSSTP